MTGRLERALRMTVLVGEDERWRHRPLYAEIVHRAHTARLAGASVFRGIEGFGGSALVHTSRLLSVGDDMPVAVVVVDREERIRSFLPQLDELLDRCLVTLDACEVLRPAEGPGDGLADGPAEGPADGPGEAR
ncbi:DUF190 domain-containing protein [Kitasatospora cheerisanensis]|uniref:Uncharacterized protein n=1 Tax=Kitasatospora cheerisanensis KCTC 2395 TaxID=1348663 RepID=A0A066ZBL8_9ACTN|nr:DUF190 domain-containing protein [Kitasatospora cheerisanensis]KDN87676.1 hypothetical protein KCH_05970 [Kitasatospora cheerisanensis KCTC 2395]